MEKRKTILVIDASPAIRKTLCALLADEYDLLEASDGLIALDLLQHHTDDISALLLDLAITDFNGIQILSYLFEHNLYNKIPTIVIASSVSDEVLSHAYNLGVSDIIAEPFPPNIVKKRIRNVIALYSQELDFQEIIYTQSEAFEQAAALAKESNDLMIDVLSSMIESRNPKGSQHIRRVREFTKVLLYHAPDYFPDYFFTEREIDLISHAAAVHDIGKIALADSILLKSEKLTPDEFELAKSHTVKGAEILFRMEDMNDKEFLGYCYEICLHHHERWDGSGYPDGLVGDDIPLISQIVALADVFDSLTHSRPYNRIYSIEEAASMVSNGHCGAFSPTLLKCFQQALPEIQSLNCMFKDTDS